MPGASKQPGNDPLRQLSVSAYIVPTELKGFDCPQGCDLGSFGPAFLVESLQQVLIRDKNQSRRQIARLDLWKSLESTSGGFSQDAGENTAFSGLSGNRDRARFLVYTQNCHITRLSRNGMRLLCSAGSRLGVENLNHLASVTQSKLNVCQVIRRCLCLQEVSEEKFSDFST